MDPAEVAVLRAELETTRKSLAEAVSPADLSTRLNEQAAQHKELMDAGSQMISRLDETVKEHEQRAEEKERLHTEEKQALASSHQEELRPLKAEHEKEVDRVTQAAQEKHQELVKELRDLRAEHKSWTKAVMDHIGWLHTRFYGMCLISAPRLCRLENISFFFLAEAFPEATQLAKDAVISHRRLLGCADADAKGPLDVDEQLLGIDTRVDAVANLLKNFRLVGRLVSSFLWPGEKLDVDGVTLCDRLAGSQPRFRE